MFFYSLVFLKAQVYNTANLNEKMEITPLIQKAIAKIGEIHQDQPRRAEDFPYVAHPYAVAIMLSTYTQNEDIIVAGLLHDVLEDVDPTIYSGEDICRDFSHVICHIVQEVSVLETAHRRSVLKLSWRSRKLKYLAQLKTASPEALIICAADKIHFLQSIMTSYSQQGDELWAKFNALPEERLWFCQEILQILQNRLNHRIVHKFANTLAKATPILKSPPKIPL